WLLRHRGSRLRGGTISFPGLSRNPEHAGAAMIFDDITDMARALPRTGALAGLDLGTKTIGVAVSDGMRQIASPLRVIRRRKFTLDAADLLTIVAERRLTGLILGLPR